MKTKALAAAALSLCLLAAAGCGGKKGKTPKDAAKNLVNSLLKGDKDLFLSSVHYGEADKEVVEARFEMLAAMTEFSAKFGKAYGAGMFEGTQLAVTEEDAEKLKIEVSGDTAVARSPPMKLVKKDGTWYVDISGDMPKGEDAKKAVSAYGRMARGIKLVTDKIGREGQDAGKLRDEFEAATGAGAMAPGGNE